MLEIEIDGMAKLVTLAIDSTVLIVIGLEVHVRARPEVVVPAPQDIAGPNLDLIIICPLERQGIAYDLGKVLSFIGPHQVSLHSHAVPRGEVPVGAEATMPQVRGVRGRPAAVTVGTGSIGIPGECPISRFPANLTAILDQ